MKRILLILVMAAAVLMAGGCDNEVCDVCGLAPGLQIQIDYANPCGTQIQLVGYAGADGCIHVQNCEMVNSIYAQ